jgi:hypothetical protein
VEIPLFFRFAAFSGTIETVKSECKGADTNEKYQG